MALSECQVPDPVWRAAVVVFETGENRILQSLHKFPAETENLFATSLKGAITQAGGIESA